MLMQIDGTFLFAAISFLIFLVIIKFILFNPITKVLEERENFYAKNSKMKNESNEKTKALLEEKEIALKKSREEANEIIKEANLSAKLENEFQIKEAKKEANRNLDEHNLKLNEQSASVKQELKQEVSNFVSLMVSKILKEEITVNVDEEKIKKHLKI